MTPAGRAFLALACLLAASPASAVRIEVVDADGAGVGDVKLQGFVTRATQALIEVRRDAVAVGATDDAGSVDLPLPAVPRLLLIVDPPGRMPKVLEVDPTSSAVLRLRVEDGARLRGKALSDGRLQGKACVRWRKSVESLGRSFEFERCADLAPDGAFTVAGLDSALAGRLTILAEGHLPLSAQLPDARAETYRLIRGARLEGMVLGPGDRPVLRARVAVKEAGEALSDEGGRFSVPLAALPARLSIHAAGYRRLALDVRELTPLRLSLKPGATLEARVLDGGGKPIPNVKVLLRRQAGDNTWTREEVDAETHKGDLLLDLPRPGLYRFEIRSAGMRPFSSEPFAVTATQGANLGVVVLSAGGGVEGRVVDAASGRPLAGVLATLWPQGMAGIQRAAVSAMVGQAVADSEGRYRIAGQAPGAYELRLERSGFAAAYREVALLDDLVLPMEDAVLDAGVAVSGTVKNRAGKPRRGVQVRFLAESGASPLAVAETATGEDGEFGGLHLAAGDYRVEVRSDRVLLARNVRIEGSEPKHRLDLRTAETAVSGTVLRRGQVVQGGWLEAEVAWLATPRSGRLVLRTPDGQQETLGGSENALFQTEVGPDGSFSFEDVPVGRLLITYLTPEGHALTRLLDLPPAGAEALPIDFSGARLEGIARLKNNGEPLVDVAVELRDAEGSPLGTAVTDAAGRFVFEDVSAAEVLVEATRTGFAARTEQVSLQGKPTAMVAIDLDPSEDGTVAVRLQGEGGQPLAFSFVTLVTEGGALVRSLPLDALGSRRFEGISAGSYRLIWSNPVYGLGMSAAIHVQGGREAVVEERLVSPARLELACQADPCNRSPLEALGLFSAPGLDLASLLPGFSPGLAFSDDGRLSLGAIQPGGYRLAGRVAGTPFDVVFQAAPGQIVRIPVGRPEIPKDAVAAKKP